MACRQIIGAKLHRTLQEIAELNFPIAHDVRIWRASALVFIQKISEYLVKILPFKINGIVGDADLFTYAANVFRVLFRRAMTEFIGIIPVFHKNADNVIALLLQQQRSDGGIDAAGHADDYPCRSFWFIHRKHHLARIKQLLL